MQRTRETIAVIPARGGSRGIPRKNIQDLGGLPLLAYSVLVARAARRVSRVVVSTDDEEIADVARRHGAEVPFLRPAGISGDQALIGDAVKHMLDGLKAREGYDPDVVATMYPTHPFRAPGLVDHLLGRIEAGYKAVVTVRPVSLAGHVWCALGPDGRLRTLRPDPSGPADLAHRSYGLFEAHSTRPAPLGFYLHELRSAEELIDIDDPVDLELARSVAQGGVYRLEAA